MDFRITLQMWLRIYGNKYKNQVKSCFPLTLFAKYNFYKSWVGMNHPPQNLITKGKELKLSTALVSPRFLLIKSSHGAGFY